MFCGFVNDDLLSDFVVEFDVGECEVLLVKVVCFCGCCVLVVFGYTLMLVFCGFVLLFLLWLFVVKRCLG
jgi:hypothetical protein